MCVTASTSVGKLDEVMKESLVKPSMFLVCVVLTSSNLNFHLRVGVIYATSTYVSDTSKHGI